MSGQQWDAGDYSAHARFVSDLGAPVLELLEPRAGEHILDLGCGDGALTERLVTLGCSVVGVDASSEMIAAARSRGIDARLMDAAALPFASEFDAVFSNAVLHWIADQTPVLAAGHRALRPGGRFVGELGGHGCVAAICTALRAIAGRHGVDLRLPWNFPTAEDFEQRLAAAGLEADVVRLVPRPTALPSDMRGWLRVFAGWAFDGLEPEQQEAAYGEVVELLRPALCDARGRWTADYMRLRFAARRVGNQRP